MGNGNVYLLVTGATFFWGSNFVLGGFVLNDMPPLWAAALRFALAAVLMLVIAGIRREQLFIPLRRHAATYLLLGLLGGTAFSLFFFYALRYTSADNAALIMATNPLLTTLLAALFLSERPGTRHIVALPIALAGVAVVVTQGKLANLLALHLSFGDLLMFGADTSWALYNVACRRYMPPASSLVNTAWITVAGALLLTGVALGSGAHLGSLGEKAAISLGVMTVGGTVLAYLFWSMGIARLGASHTAIFLNLVPVFAMLLGEVFAVLPTSAQLVGGLLVLGGVSVSMLPSRRLAAA